MVICFFLFFCFFFLGTIQLWELPSLHCYFMIIRYFHICSLFSRKYKNDLAFSEQITVNALSDNCSAIEGEGHTYKQWEVSVCVARSGCLAVSLLWARELEWAGCFFTKGVSENPAFVFLVLFVPISSPWHPRWSLHFLYPTLWATETAPLSPSWNPIITFS